MRDIGKNAGSREREIPKRDDLKDYNYAVAGQSVLRYFPV